mmetsp:Transcript_77042/g.249302  ORF Transcript_77042/g.249302 Transcript_77042/m.249302 type:complete len:214 (-) Transcript_77042:777-1418(-)
MRWSSTSGWRRSFARETSGSTGPSAPQRPWPPRSGGASSTPRPTSSAVAWCSSSCSASPCPSRAATTMPRPSATGAPCLPLPGLGCTPRPSTPWACAAGCSCRSGAAGPWRRSACGRPSCSRASAARAEPRSGPRSTCCSTLWALPSGACSTGASRCPSRGPGLPTSYRRSSACSTHLMPRALAGSGGTSWKQHSRGLAFRTLAPARPRSPWT